MHTAAHALHFTLVTAACRPIISHTLTLVLEVVQLADYPIKEHAVKVHLSSVMQQVRQHVLPIVTHVCRSPLGGNGLSALPIQPLSLVQVTPSGCSSGLRGSVKSRDRPPSR